LLPARTLRENAHAGLAHRRSEQTLGQELKHDNIAVFISDKARQFIGLTEAQAASVVCGIEQRLASGDGRAQPRLKELEPRGFVERFARDEAQRNLRGRTVERRAQQQTAAVGHMHQRFIWF
jgi:hypothetical protein